jgi:peptide/nickel transport system permease protein
MAITPTVQAGDPLRDSGDRRRLLSRIGFVVATPYRQSAGIARGMLVAGTLVTGLMVVLAVFAPLIAPFRFDQVAGAGGERFPKQEAPSGNHWFGTSVQTFDVFSRVVWGARTELKVVILSLVLTIAIGVVLGIVSGFVGGWLDRVLVLVMDALFCFPYLLLAIVVAFLLADKLGGGVTTAAAAITAVYIPQYFRVVRNSTVSAKQATYVEAARALGAPAHVIMARYLFTNVVQSVPVIATLNAADAVGTLAALGFLGYGIQPTEAAEWGYDLNRAIDDAGAGIWWTGLFPGTAIVLLVTGFTLVGEGLNDVLNPVIRARRLRKPKMSEQPPTGEEPSRA